jgi:hypothetical protein
MITNPTDFLLGHFEEVEALIEDKQWEDADLLVGHLAEYMHLFDSEMLDKYYDWVDNIQYGLGYE